MPRTIDVDDIRARELQQLADFVRGEARAFGLEEAVDVGVDFVALKVLLQRLYAHAEFAGLDSPRPQLDFRDEDRAALRQYLDLMDGLHDRLRRRFLDENPGRRRR